jgi:hypothetical protein
MSARSRSPLGGSEQAADLPGRASRARGSHRRPPSDDPCPEQRDAASGGRRDPSGLRARPARPPASLLRARRATCLLVAGAPAQVARDPARPESPSLGCCAAAAQGGGGRPRGARPADEPSQAPRGGLRPDATRRCCRRAGAREGGPPARAAPATRAARRPQPLVRAPAREPRQRHRNREPPVPGALAPPRWTGARQAHAGAAPAPAAQPRDRRGSLPRTSTRLGHGPDRLASGHPVPADPREDISSPSLASARGSAPGKNRTCARGLGNRCYPNSCVQKLPIMV